jgi:hypothetical protein
MAIRHCEVGQQTFGGGFAAVHGKDAINDQFFHGAAVTTPAPQDDLASRAMVAGDSVDNLHQQTVSLMTRQVDLAQSVKIRMWRASQERRQRAT